MDLTNKVSMLDDAFSNLLMKKTTESELESSLAVILTGLTENKKNFTVSIIQNTSRKEPFFGMRIFPLQSSLDDILKLMIQNEEASFKSVTSKWSNLAKWHIEIDSQVFNRNEINFTPSELTALLLHEIGHTVQSDEVIERVYRAHRECEMRMSVADKASDKLMYFLYSIPLTVGCSVRNWKIGKNAIRQEIFADKSVDKLGYGESLMSAFRKIIKSYGNSDCTADDAEDAAIDNSINWCILNTSDLIVRKNKLKDDLYYRSVKTNSGFIKANIQNIMTRMGIVSRNRYTGAAVESSIEVFDSENFIQENELSYDIKKFGFIERSWNDDRRRATSVLEAFGKSKKKPEIPSQLDVDAIGIEIDRITNHMDRRYVLDLIYNQIEKIEAFKELCEINLDLKKAYNGKMERMIDELESMRKVVLSKRNFEKSYKVFVKYPANYEG